MLRIPSKTHRTASPEIVARQVKIVVNRKLVLLLKALLFFDTRGRAPRMMHHDVEPASIIDSNAEFAPDLLELLQAQISGSGALREEQHGSSSLKQLSTL